MAQFRSSAREGSFSNNQLAAPDTVKKIQQEGNRVLQGMNAHEQQLQQLRNVADIARKNSQSIQEKGRELAFRSEESALQAQKERSEELWKLQLEREASKEKTKFNTIGALTEFSKTAFDITSNIVKTNKELQQKAIKQLAYKHGVTTQQLRDIAALDEGMTFSAFQQTSYAQEIIKNGGTLEQLNFQHKHLLKGNGYKNYVDNGFVLRNQALQIASTLYEDIDPNLSADEYRSEISRRTIAAVDQFRVNGVDPRVEMLEEHAFPAIRDAEKRALARVNKKVREEVDFESRTTQVHAARNTWNPGDGVKRHAEVARLMATTRTKDTRRAIVSAVADDPSTTVGDIRKLLSTPIEVNGQMRTLRDYPDEAAILEQKITELEDKEKQDTENEIKERNLQTEVALQQEFDAGADSWDQEDQDRLEALAKELGGAGYTSQTVEATKKYVIDGADGLAADEWNERWTMALEAGTASRAMLEDVNLPYQMEVKALQQLATLEGLRSTKEYSTAINSQLKNSVLNASGLKYNIGEAKDPSVHWKIEETKARFKRYVSLYSITNPDNAVQMALDKVIQENETQLKGDPNAVENGRIVEYNTYLSEQKKAQEDAKVERDALNAVSSSRTLRTNPENWANALNQERFIEQVQEYQINGDSQYLRSLGVQMKPNAPLAPWEVIKFLAPKIEGVEAIDAPKGWEEIVQFVDDQDRYNLFGDSPQAARLRTLQKIRLRSQGKTTQELAVRPVFDNGAVDVDTFINAIAGNETGGEANPQTARNSRTDASGFSQILPSNIPSWSRQFIGREVTQEEFLASPEIQMAITRGKLQQIMQQEMNKGYTGELLLRRVASEWYSGDPDLYDNDRGQGPLGKEPSIRTYTTDILGRYKSNFRQAPNVETGQNTGIQITSANDASGEPGSDFVISGGKRGAKFHFPFKSKVVEVVRDQNWETNLENDPNGKRGYGNYVDVETDLGNGIVADARIAHFDDVANLSVGQQIPAGAFIGTQGRTGSTTGSHISIDWYYPGTNRPYPEARDYFLNNYLRKN